MDSDQLPGHWDEDEVDLERLYRMAANRVTRAVEEMTDRIGDSLVEADALEDLLGGRINDDVEEVIEEDTEFPVALTLYIGRHPYTRVPFYLWRAAGDAGDWVIKLWPTSEGWAYAVDEPRDKYDVRTGPLFERAEESGEEPEGTELITLTQEWEEDLATSAAEALGRAIVRLCQEAVANPMTWEADLLEEDD